MMQVELILKISFRDKPRQGQIIGVEDLWKLMKEDLLRLMLHVVGPVDHLGIGYLGGRMTILT